MHRGFSSTFLLSLLALLTADQFRQGEAKATDPPRGRLKLPEGAALRIGTPDLRQGERVHGVVVLDGGKQFATLSTHYLIIWDATTGQVVSLRELPPLREPEPGAPPAAGSLIVTADGSALVAVRENGVTFHKLPPEKNDPISLPPTPKRGDVITGVAPGAKNADVLGITLDGGMLRWSPGDRQWTTLDPPGFGEGATVVASGGGVVVIRERIRKDRIYLWDVAQGKSVGTQDGGSVSAIAVSADGKRFITAGKTYDVRAVSDQQNISSWNRDAGSGTIAISPDGTLAAVARASYGRPFRPPSGTQASIHDSATGKVQHTLQMQGGILHLAFLSDKELLTVDIAGAIQIWDIATGQSRPKPTGSRGDIRGLTCEPNGGWLSADSQGVITHWNAQGEKVRRFEGHTYAVAGLALTKDGRTLYSAGNDGTVREWDTETGKERRKCVVDTRLLHCLALSPNGKWLAAGVGNGEVRLLDTKGLTVEKTVSPPKRTPRPVMAVAFASDESLVSRDSDGKTHVWHVSDKRELHQIALGGGVNVLSARLAIAPDGKAFASPVIREGAAPPWGASATQSDVGIWETETGKLLMRVRTETNADITALVYLPGGKDLVVGNAVGTVWVIDLEKKETRHTFKGHRGAVLSLAVSPDGKMLASGGADTTIHVWNLSKP